MLQLIQTHRLKLCKKFIAQEFSQQIPNCPKYKVKLNAELTTERKPWENMTKKQTHIKQIHPTSNQLKGKHDTTQVITMVIIHASFN